MDRLYRSRTNRVLGGVAGGLGEYFQVDPVIIRVIFVLLALVQANAVLFYLIAWLVIPEESTVEESSEIVGDGGKDQGEHRRRLLGGLLIIVGLVFLGQQLLTWIDLAWLVPIALIAAGIVVLARGRR